MGLFKNLFGKRKQKISPRLIKIEAEIGLEYPNAFRQFLNGNLESKIIFQLPDDDYQLLDSFTSDSEAKDPMENATLMSLEIAHHLGWTNQRALPFALNLSRDRTKFIFFLVKDEVVMSDQLYYVDLDSDVREIEISSLINIFGSKDNTKNDPKHVMYVQSINNAIFENFELPNRVKLWDNSHNFNLKEGAQVKDSINLDIEQHATNYIFEDTNETMARMDIQITLQTKGNTLFVNSGYEISDSNLQFSMANWDYLRTFYYKYLCQIDAVNRVREILIDQKLLDNEEIFKLFNVNELIDYTKQSFKSLNNEYP